MIYGNLENSIPIITGSTNRLIDLSLPWASLTTEAAYISAMFKLNTELMLYCCLMFV